MMVYDLVKRLVQTTEPAPADPTTPDDPTAPADPRAIASEPGVSDFDSPSQSADRLSAWGAIGVGAAVSLAIHLGVLWLPMDKAKKPPALPLSNQTKPVPVQLARSTPGSRSTLTPRPSPAAQSRQPAPQRDRAAQPSTPPAQRSRPPQSTGPAPARSPRTSNPSPRHNSSPSPSPNTNRSPSGPTSNGSPSPSPSSAPVSPSPDPIPQPPGLPGLEGLEVGGAACASGQSCYRVPDSIHSVTSELIQNSLGPTVQVREITSTYENTEVAREFEVTQAKDGQSPQVVGYYYVISTQVLGQTGTVIFGSRDRLATLNDIKAAAGANG